MNQISDKMIAKYNNSSHGSKSQKMLIKNVIGFSVKKDVAKEKSRKKLKKSCDESFKILNLKTRKTNNIKDDIDFVFDSLS